MREPSLNFLRTLVNTPSPTGHEVRGQRVWLDYVKALADEIAMAVNYINDEGFVYVRKMGGIDAAITRAQRVCIHTRDGAVKGVVGNVAPHLSKHDDDKHRPPK